MSTRHLHLCGWREDEPGDVHQLVRDLQAGAALVRALEDEAVSRVLFNEVMIPEAYASLFEDLASKIEVGIAQRKLTD